MAPWSNSAVYYLDSIICKIYIPLASIFNAWGINTPWEIRKAGQVAKGRAFGTIQVARWLVVFQNNGAKYQVDRSFGGVCLFFPGCLFTS